MIMNLFHFWWIDWIACGEGNVNVVDMVVEAFNRPI